MSVVARIAVLIPCHNEAATVAKVVADFREALPEARVLVFDNASTDATAALAREAGARVLVVPAKGKGHVVRSMFRDVDADVYVMVDGDDTYPAAKVRELIAPVVSGNADMVVGTRLEMHRDGSFRRFHGFGNRLVRGVLSSLFHTTLADVLSGYRAFSARFVRSMPVLSQGFEIETEMTVFALSQGMQLCEVPVPYGMRPEGSHSKLHTFRDGYRVLRTILFLYKDYRPLQFFGLIALACIVAGIGFGTIVVREFAMTGLVTHPSTAVLAVALVLLGMLSLATGLVLDTVNRRSQELMRLLTDQVLAKPGRSTATDPGEADRA
ncbi:MAG TPA: glycosyltransferase [Xanthomonadaceae bacterium]|jgi:glycosyltransferase involved in cell wall biosynthesis